jgi:hypothetical protein
MARGPDKPRDGGPPSDPNPFDRRIKSIVALFPADLVTWLLKVKPLEVRELDPTIVRTEERRSDKLLLAVFEGEAPVAVHVDFQTEGRSNVPERMARFQLLLGSSKEVRERGARLASFAVYLDRKTYRKDPGRFELPATMGTSYVSTYTVVKLWEEDPGDILAMESPGLCPFLPLLRGDPKKLFVESRKKIEGAVPARLPAGTREMLLAAMTVLAARVIKDTHFLRRCISEVRAMGDNWVIDELHREGKAIGRVEGRTEEARRCLLSILERRFGDVSEDIRRRVEGLSVIERLEFLHDEAVTCGSLAAFRDLLEGD